MLKAYVKAGPILRHLPGFVAFQSYEHEKKSVDTDSVHSLLRLGIWRVQRTASRKQVRHHPFLVEQVTRGYKRLKVKSDIGVMKPLIYTAFTQFHYMLGCDVNPGRRGAEPCGPAPIHTLKGFLVKESCVRCSDEVFTTMINAYAESGDVESARVRGSDNFTMHDSPVMVKMDRCRTVCSGKRKSGPSTTLIIVGFRTGSRVFAFSFEQAWFRKAKESGPCYKKFN